MRVRPAVTKGGGSIAGWCGLGWLQQPASATVEARTRAAAQTVETRARAWQGVVETGARVCCGCGYGRRRGRHSEKLGLGYWKGLAMDAGDGGTGG